MEHCHSLTVEMRRQLCWLLPSIFMWVGSRDQTQVNRFTKQAHLSVEPFFWTKIPLYMMLINLVILHLFHLFMFILHGISWTLGFCELMSLVGFEKLLTTIYYYSHHWIDYLLLILHFSLLIFHVLLFYTLCWNIYLYNNPFKTLIF